jgi:nucleotide-binding universal stress UspA family protein
LPAHEDRLFVDILVPVAGPEAHWVALRQALLVAQREQGRLHGLHVIPADADKEKQENRDMRSEFESLCQQADVRGELTFETGRVVRAICSRARWSDLVVVHFSHLPRPRPDDRLASGLGAVIRQCPRPVLALTDGPAPLQRALLAYDGSPKAREALFVAAYLAGKWQTTLVVVTVTEGSHIAGATLTDARQYLESRDIKATFVQEEGNVGQAIIRTAQLYECDFLIMGGYGFNPVVEVMLGSEVDLILRARQWPVLICR